jgi:DNA-binding CsgD family transcriptional regulator
MTGTLPDLISSATLLYARGRTRIAAGSLRHGLDDLLKAGDMLARFQIHDPQTVPWRIAAAGALIELGDHDEARALGAEQLRLARALDAPHALGPALHLQGLVTGGSDGARMLAEAVSLLEPSFGRLELARALVDLGGVTRERGEPARARELLERGATLAEQLGSVALARRATTELVSAGGRPRRATRLGVRALTPAERHVARLAAEGLTNREVAETLVVSRKTVETHMTKAFRKLGIRTRDELRGVLAHDSAHSRRP